MPAAIPSYSSSKNPKAKNYRLIIHDYNFEDKIVFSAVVSNSIVEDIIKLIRDRYSLNIVNNVFDVSGDGE